MNAIITKHKLDFEAAESALGLLFRVGTCEGQYIILKDSVCILSVINNSPHNGHLDDVFEWFEYSAKSNNINLLVLECMNKKFYNHLVFKRGFSELDKNMENCIRFITGKNISLF